MWKCEYCGRTNESKRVACVSCGGSRPVTRYPLAPILPSSVSTCATYSDMWQGGIEGRLTALAEATTRQKNNTVFAAMLALERAYD